MNRDVNVKMQAVKRCVHDFEDLHTNKTDTQSECAFSLYTYIEKRTAIITQYMLRKHTTRSLTAM